MRNFVLNFILLSAVGYACLILGPSAQVRAASTKAAVQELANQQQALATQQQALSHGQQTLNHKQQALVNNQQVLVDGQHTLANGQQTMTHEQQIMLDKTEVLARREDWIKSAIPPTIAALGALLLSIMNRRHIQNLNVNVNGRISRLIELEVAAAEARGIEAGRKQATGQDSGNPQSV